MFKLVRDGVETRYRDWVEAREDRSFTFVEHHELVERWQLCIGHLFGMDLVQLRANGTSRAIDYPSLKEAASAITRADLRQGAEQLKIGEATELYYQEADGSSQGRIVLARIG